MTTYYGIDADATHTVGRQIAALDTDVHASKNALVTALDAVTPGTRHGVGDVDTGVDTFRTWAIDTANSVANGVSNLGNNTSNGANTAVDTNNLVVPLFNNQTLFNRPLNRLPPIGT